ncbi:hypothetical protein K438DRAFT_1997608 [Mycena galopus ATCC 62051]|nr:hypothetical protein K438DRAFT_1997608 [Mycena galopus ATCC 62051]
MFPPIPAVPLLEKLKGWIRITDQDEFNACWTEIQALAPPSVIEYLETYRMKVVRLWLAIYRVDHTIFDLGDTNMLVEAWHHLLKGNFLEGKPTALVSASTSNDHLILLECGDFKLIKYWTETEYLTAKKERKDEKGKASMVEAQSKRGSRRLAAEDENVMYWFIESHDSKPVSGRQAQAMRA